MKKGLILIVLFLSFQLAGCTTRLVDFTMISTKNIDLSRGANFERGKARVEGKDTASIIIIIPTGVPSMKEAIDRAIESVPGAVALVDGVVTESSFWIPYIYGETTFIVEGTPLIDPALVKTGLESNYMISKINKKGEVEDFRFVNKDQYDALKKKYKL